MYEPHNRERLAELRLKANKVVQFLNGLQGRLEILSVQEGKSEIMVESGTAEYYLDELVEWTEKHDAKYRRQEEKDRKKMRREANRKSKEKADESAVDKKESK